MSGILRELLTMLLILTCSRYICDCTHTFKQLTAGLLDWSVGKKLDVIVDVDDDTTYTGCR